MTSADALVLEVELPGVRLAILDTVIPTQTPGRVTAEQIWELFSDEYLHADAPEDRLDLAGLDPERRDAAEAERGVDDVVAVAASGENPPSETKERRGGGASTCTPSNCSRNSSRACSSGANSRSRTRSTPWARRSKIFKMK